MNWTVWLPEVSHHDYAPKKLALFHHSPDATDDMIDEVVERTTARTAVPVIAAAEGSYLDI